MPSPQRNAPAILPIPPKKGGATKTSGEKPCHRMTGQTPAAWRRARRTRFEPSASPRVLEEADRLRASDRLSASASREFDEDALGV